MFSSFPRIFFALFISVAVIGNLNSVLSTEDKSLERTNSRENSCFSNERDENSQEFYNCEAIGESEEVTDKEISDRDSRGDDEESSDPDVNIPEISEENNRNGNSSGEPSQPEEPSQADDVD